MTGKTFTEVGILLDNGDEKSTIAQTKYGENHSKLGALLDLTFVETTGKSNVTLTPIGALLRQMSIEESNNLMKKLMFRIPVIRQLLKNTKYNDKTSITECLKIIPSKITRERRKSSVYALIRTLMETSDYEFYIRIESESY